ncbi:MAG: ATP-binding cassette domain-containing protein [bacterium]|nr:ATP-binding cassette domain-containing protein [bacterium]
MIRVENLVKYYGDFQALRSINFEIHDGEIVGFLGANGAGKSTTLKIMTGFLTPTSGNVHVNELNILDHSLEIREQIGYLPELNPLYLEMKVFDYLEFNARIRQMDVSAFKQGLDRVVDDCGLKGVMHLPISACSKGYKQRVGLAAAMIHDPKMLILDEPVSGLDPNQIVEIRELIKNLGQEKIVIMSSHILQEIEATVNRILIIHEGEIVADGTSQGLMASFKGRTQLTLEVKYASDESLSGLGNQVAGIDVVGTEAVNGHHVVSLEYDGGSDPREDIFNYAKGADWAILEMSQSRVELEDVFRRLTVDQPAAESQSAPAEAPSPPTGEEGGAADE